MRLAFVCTLRLLSSHGRRPVRRRSRLQKRSCCVTRSWTSPWTTAATRYVSTNGGLRFHNRYITVAPALIGEHVGLEEVADGRWALYFYNHLLGHLSEREGHVHGVHIRRKAIRSET